MLDEPLNGLDPMARAEVIGLFRELAEAGLHVIVSSHILHEVDRISDQVILVNHGYVVAEGEIEGVRDEMEEHPMQILVRCDRPSLLAARVFEHDHVVEARIQRRRPRPAGAAPATPTASTGCCNRSVIDDELGGRSRWRRPTTTSTRSIST